MMLNNSIKAQSITTSLKDKIFIVLIITAIIITLWLASKGNEIIVPAEVRCDDGVAEWRSFLIDSSQTIQKELVLLQNVVGIYGVFLKIYMNGAGLFNRNEKHTYDMVIKVDDQVVKIFEGGPPEIRDWYLIPIDKGMIEGKSSILVTISVQGNPGLPGNYVNIMGDANPPTKYSKFNGQKEDLSLDEGIQTGEYMIRLVYQ